MMNAFETHNQHATDEWGTLTRGGWLGGWLDLGIILLVVLITVPPVLLLILRFLSCCWSTAA
jgi:hypothetical protein